jgi:general secretion pathway protein D
MNNGGARGPMNFASASPADAVTQNSSVLGQMPLDGIMPGASSLGNNPTLSAGGQGGAAQADFDTLINLIKSTIEPLSWDDQGGSGTIQPFPGNLSLVVSATQQVHEEIRDLLEQLRKSQDLQVTIEVRMITLTDNFFERIGIDFDFEIDDNVDPSQIQDDSGPSAMFGIDSQGPTIDLDLVFEQNDAYASAIPQFGAYDAGTAAQFGFAILSDIEVFFLLEAAQGDTRSNVLTAPKVTLFNGQTASVSDLSQRPFVTGLTPVVGDFAVAHQPIIVVLGEGTTMSVQAVVSEDRRFVRLTLVPFFSRIGNVEEFTFDGETTTSTGETVLDDDGNPINRNNQSQTSRGTTVQLPTFNFTSVSTTVSVPDGGTVLLGGIKRLAEGRSERGVPMLAQLPYISRLFKNVGIGRDTESLMMMVTPRIIIQEEEEKRQTGITADDL